MIKVINSKTFNGETIEEVSGYNKKYYDVTYCSETGVGTLKCGDLDIAKVNPRHIETIGNKTVEVFTLVCNLIDPEKVEAE